MVRSSIVTTSACTPASQLPSGETKNTSLPALRAATDVRPKDCRPRPTRWAAAVGQLRTLQAECEAWRDQLPEALQPVEKVEESGVDLSDGVS